jgi:DNA-binding helix-hairpin-helix protein with protein kinase domain
MIKNHPFDGDVKKQSYKDSVAWPSELIRYSNGRFIGFIMPKISGVEINQIINPSNRKTLQKVYTTQNLYQIAYNIAVLFNGLHSKNYVIGDINNKNFFVSSNFHVVMVDCDSIQVTASDGVVYKCGVGVPEYTPPELHEQDLSTIVRTINHDCFGLAIIIFQLLMQGFHPFSGKYKSSKKDISEITQYFMQKKIFPFDTSNQHVEAPPIAPDYEACIPESLRTLFARAFTQNNRPTAAEWEKELSLVLLDITKCQL